jgi:hypothetical protein
MTLVLDLPDSWESLLGLDSGDATQRALQMLVLMNEIAFGPFPQLARAVSSRGALKLARLRGLERTKGSNHLILSSRF